MATREPLSQHARIFSGDALYEFHGSALADQIGRSPAQVQRELEKLLALGALVEQAAPGMRRPMRRSETKLAAHLFALPPLIESRLGPYAPAADFE